MPDFQTKREGVQGYTSFPAGYRKCGGNITDGVVLGKYPAHTVCGRAG